MHMTPARSHPPGFQDGVAERLAAAGRSPAAIAALLDLDQGLFLWHRAVAKGEGIMALLSELAIPLELAEFSALTAVARISQGVGRAAAEPPTIGALAQELAIDPSRASRLAAQLIEAGHLRREAAQDDARKTILTLTDQARAVLARVRELKWDRYIAIFADWPDEDITRFALFLRRYRERSAQVFARPVAPAAE